MVYYRFLVKNILVKFKDIYKCVDVVLYIIYIINFILLLIEIHLKDTIL